MPVAHVIPPSLRAFGIDEVQPQQKLDPNKYEVPRGVDRRDAFDAMVAARRASGRLRRGCPMTVGTPSTRRRLPDDRRDAFDATAAARWRARTRRPAQVLGQDMQVLRIHLNRGEKALAEPGAMVYMSENVEAGCDSAKWWPRCMGCEPCCFATFEAKGDGAYVGLTPNRPAKVLPLVLGGRRFLGKKGMYFASTGHVDVDFNMDLNPVTCCCGGQGMIRQVLKGDGIAFIGAMGVLTHKVLAPGEKLIVDTCVETKIYGAFSTSTPSARRLPDGVAMPVQPVVAAAFAGACGLRRAGSPSSRSAAPAPCAPTPSRR